MSTLQTSLALLLCVCVAACGDDWVRDGDVAGADAGGTSFPDATPPAPDAEPESTNPLDDLPVDLACTLEEIQPLIECITDNCLESISDGDVATCVAINCGLLLLGLPQECTQCVLAAIADPSNALDACVLGLDELDGLPLPPAP